jgi:hypothetical protein
VSDDLVKRTLWLDRRDWELLIAMHKGWGASRVVRRLIADYAAQLRASKENVVERTTNSDAD